MLRKSAWCQINRRQIVSNWPLRELLSHDEMLTTRFSQTVPLLLRHSPEVAQMIQSTLINFARWSHATLSRIHLWKTIFTLRKIRSNNYLLMIPTELPMFISMDCPLTSLKMNYTRWLHRLGRSRALGHSLAMWGIVKAVMALSCKCSRKLQYRVLIVFSGSRTSSRQRGVSLPLGNTATSTPLFPRYAPLVSDANHDWVEFKANS